MLSSLDSRCRGSNLHAGSHWIVLERLIGACCLCVLSFHLKSHQVLMLFGVGVFFFTFFVSVIVKSNLFWFFNFVKSSFSQFVSVCTLLKCVRVRVRAVRAAAGAWSPAGGGAEASRAADPAHERETVSVHRQTQAPRHLWDSVWLIHSLPTASVLGRNYSHVTQLLTSHCNPLLIKLNKLRMKRLTITKELHLNFSLLHTHI